MILEFSSVVNRLLVKTWILENIDKHSELMLKLGPRYLSLSKIYFENLIYLLKFSILLSSWI